MDTNDVATLPIQNYSILMIGTWNTFVTTNDLIMFCWNHPLSDSLDYESDFLHWKAELGLMF